LSENTKDPVIVPTSTEQAVPVGASETPVVTISQIPGSLNVGDKVKPKANVKREDGTTPIQNCPVDFFVEDTLGRMALGNRVLANASGDAEATEYYWVGTPEAGLSVKFIIVTRRTVV